MRRRRNIQFNTKSNFHLFFLEKHTWNVSCCHGNSKIRNLFVNAWNEVQDCHMETVSLVCCRIFFKNHNDLPRPLSAVFLHACLWRTSQSLPSTFLKPEEGSLPTPRLQYHRAKLKLQTWNCKDHFKEFSTKQGPFKLGSHRSQNSWNHCYDANCTW